MLLAMSEGQHDIAELKIFLVSLKVTKMVPKNLGGKIFNSDLTVTISH